MKVTISLVSALLSIGLVSAASIPADLESRGGGGGGRRPPCGPRYQAIPLFRAFDAQAIDHFYTTNRGELRNSALTAEGTAAYIFPYQQQQTTPLYRLYNRGNTDHFYTTDVQERNNAVGRLGYRYEGVAGYVYTEAVCGSVPLYRLYSARGTDHFYTTSTNERDSAARNGYVVEGFAGFVFNGLY